MRRRAALLCALAVMLSRLVAPPAADPQPSARVVRIGVLSYAPLPALFTAMLRERGYVEGENLTIVGRFAGGASERFPRLARELVELRVQVIVAVTNPAILAAQQVTTSIPIVMLAALEPFGAGLVASLARPGGNVTGTTMHTPEVAGKILDILHEAIPQAKRVALLSEPDFPGVADYIKAADSAARALDLTLQHHDVRALGDVQAALVTMREQPPDAVFVLPTGTIAKWQAEISDFLTHKLPDVYPLREHVDAGGLISYGVHQPEVVRQTVAYVDKLLKGAKPGELPVEQPTKFELVINLKTAKALGLTIPPSLLARADEVIE